MKPRMTRMTTMGQVVIPKELRDLAELGIGDSVSVSSHGDDIRIARRSGWARATAGSLPSSLPPLEPDKLDDLIERAADQEVRDAWGVIE